MVSWNQPLEFKQQQIGSSAAARFQLYTLCRPFNWIQLNLLTTTRRIVVVIALFPFQSLTTHWLYFGQSRSTDSSLKYAQQIGNDALTAKNDVYPPVLLL